MNHVNLKQLHKRGIQNHSEGFITLYGKTPMKNVTIFKYFRAEATTCEPYLVLEPNT